MNHSFKVLQVTAADITVKKLLLPLIDQLAMEGYQVATIEDVVGRADLFVTATGNYHVLRTEHMVKMKDTAIVCNIGHFDNEIDMAGLAKMPGIVKEEIKPQVHKWTFPDGHCIIVLAEGRLVNLGCATGHPSFVMSNSFTNQVLAQIALNQESFPVGVHLIPKKLDEKVARLHLGKLGVELDRLTDTQADYLGVPVDGPYKPDSYRY